VSADNRLCILDTRTPAVKNFHPVGPEVAGNAEYLLAILDTTGNFASLSIQFNSKLVNSHMHFFLPTIRISKNYSNVDGIEDYSNSRIFVDIPTMYTSNKVIQVCVITVLKINYKEWRNFEVLYTIYCNLGQFTLIIRKAEPIQPFQSLPWPRKHRFWHQNHRSMLNYKGVLGVCLKWRPSWTPSWISRNSQGMASVTRRILKGEILVY
jgi:hypothetical protein